jgi:hypothetical protein
LMAVCLLRSVFIRFTSHSSLRSSLAFMGGGAVPALPTLP